MEENSGKANVLNKTEKPVRRRRRILQKKNKQIEPIREILEQTLRIIEEAKAPDPSVTPSLFQSINISNLL